MLAYCVSPNYLEFIMNEFKSMETVMQGYGNFRAAAVNLISVNKSDLLGCIIVANQINIKDKWFREFLRKLNLTGKTRVVIAVSSVENLKQIASLKSKYHNLEMFGLSDYTMTDLFVRHELLGTLLKETEEYVRIKSAEKDYSKVLDTAGSSYSALVHRDVELCQMDTIKLTKSFEEAVIEDDSLGLIQSPVFKEIRMLRIKMMYGQAELQDFYTELDMCKTLSGTNKYLGISMVEVMKGELLNG